MCVCAETYKFFCLHRRGDHYNGIVPKVPVNIPVPQGAKARLVYARQELFNIPNGPLKRSTRRAIYKLDLNRRCTVLRNLRGVTYANLVKIPVERTCRARMNVQSLTICSVNSQSCRKKTNAIRDYIAENDIDVCAITESWITSEDDAIMAEITPIGYNLLVFHREGISGLWHTYHT